MRRASLNTSVLSPILQCSSLLSSAQSSHQRIYNNAEIFNIPLTVVWFDKDCVSINKLLIQWSQLQAQSSFNLQGNASSFKHSHQFLGKEYTSEKWNITCNIYFLQASAVISVSASNLNAEWVSEYLSTQAAVEQFYNFAASTIFIAFAENRV